VLFLTLRAIYRLLHLRKLYAHVCQTRRETRVFIHVYIVQYAPSVHDDHCSPRCRRRRGGKEYSEKTVRENENEAVGRAVEKSRRPAESTFRRRETAGRGKARAGFPGRAGSRALVVRGRFRVRTAHVGRVRRGRGKLFTALQIDIAVSEPFAEFPTKTYVRTVSRTCGHAPERRGSFPRSHSRHIRAYICIHVG